jgi:hypothetical protein
MLTPLPYETGFFDAVLAVRVIQYTYMKSIKRIVGELDLLLRDAGILSLQVSSYESEIRDKPNDARTKWVELGILIARTGPESGYFTISSRRKSY